MAKPLHLHGVIPAHLCPFRPDYTVDEPELRRHLRWLLDCPAVTGITTNGHAGEVWALTRDERKQVLSVVLEEVGGRVPVVAGIHADGTAEAIALARDARDLGADAILVIPPLPLMGGTHSRPEAVFYHFAAIADAVDTPMVIFEYPVRSGFCYTPETIYRLCSEIPNIVAIKDWSYDILAYEENLRAVRNVGRKISVLTSFSKSLLASLAIGADGILSGKGSVAAELQGELFAAVQAGNLEAARAVNDRLFPLARVFYREPMMDQYTRMKEALVMLGRQQRAVVRPPLQPIPAEEREAIRQALVAARLLG